jgi:dolichol-phosphate mannosyltransferase
VNGPGSLEPAAGRAPASSAAPARAAPELTIVMPVYNEGEAVEAVLRALESSVTAIHETLVVYDFDGDTTVPVIARLSAELPAIRGLRNDRGRGVLNAMRAGIDAAQGELVLITMADGSDEPQVVDAMVNLARAGADVVVGSRYVAGGRQLGGPRLKRFLSRTAGLTLHWFGGVAIHDSTTNFRLYRRSFLEAVTIESRAGFELGLELTVKAALAGRGLAEVPTTWRDRTQGESHFQLRAWLPQYLHWYLLAFRGRIGQLAHRRRRRGRPA